ncbi:type II toxin-antitoxin system Phd/YefM family antitoxin [Mitsuokella jalaludinii]|uniref:type II toxin-antitoxin system Phd/YefM family antitoxin n=1 Tax=Mitsuokella jalaludinii TaxID=187979 RepID=UPI003F94BA40
MNINTDNLIPMTEANQNFSKVARLVDQKGSVLILKNNVPRYLILDFQKIQEESTMPDEDVMAISRRLVNYSRLKSGACKSELHRY